MNDTVRSGQVWTAYADSVALLILSDPQRGSLYRCMPYVHVMNLSSGDVSTRTEHNMLMFYRIV